MDGALNHCSCQTDIPTNKLLQNFGKPADVTVGRGLDRRGVHSKWQIVKALMTENKLVLSLGIDYTLFFYHKTNVAYQFYHYLKNDPQAFCSQATIFPWAKSLDQGAPLSH